MIKKSFVSCALTTANDGSDDDEIHCFKKGQPCEKGREMLREQLKVINEVEENPFVPDFHDIDDAMPIEIVFERAGVAEDDEDGEDEIDVEII